MAANASVTTVVLAGGRASRLPGKLERPLRGEPLLARVYQNVRGIAPVVVAAAGSFGASLEAALECPIVVDRHPGRGPLAGLLSACGAVQTQWIFAVAGDAPRVTGAVLHALLDGRCDGDEAVVPEHDGRLEPLAGLYLRSALEREGYDLLRKGDASMHELLMHVKLRRIPLPATFFVNINTLADIDMVELT